MLKTIELDVTVRDKYIYRVMVRQDRVSEWCLLLTLLRFDLIETAMIVSKQGNLSIQKAKKIRYKKKTAIQNRYGKVLKGDSNPILIVPETALDYFLNFYLEFYRDRVAAVNHVDYQVYQVDERLGFDRFYLTFLLPI